MEKIQSSIMTIILSIISSGVVSAWLTHYFNRKSLLEARQWELKREACLEAMNIIDAVFGVLPWQNIPRVDRQKPIPISEMRACYNKLVISCKNAEVPRAFKKCLFLSLPGEPAPPITMGAIDDLRFAIREEFNFKGHQVRKEDRKISWITYFNWPEDKQK